MCHDCPGDDCMRLMSKGQAGRCTTKKGIVPKCFIRMDPNGREYTNVLICETQRRQYEGHTIP